MKGNFWALDDLVELLFASARAATRTSTQRCQQSQYLLESAKLCQGCQGAQVNLLVVCHVKGVEVSEAEGFQTAVRSKMLKVRSKGHRIQHFQLVNVCQNMSVQGKRKPRFPFELRF